MITSHKGMVYFLKTIDFLSNELGMISTLILFFLEGFSMASTKLFFKKA
jgi:hypothetical protein